MERRRAFTLTELLVLIGVIALVIAIVLPIVNRMRQSAGRVPCASSLRQIGQALLLYSIENRGHYPYLRSDDLGPIVFGTGALAKAPFDQDGPAANDVTAAIYLLLRTQDITPEVFVCPDSSYSAFSPTRGKGLKEYSNFTDWNKQLGYSFHNPYFSDAVVVKRTAKKWVYDNNISAQFVVAADRNPGRANGSDVTIATTQSTKLEYKLANSRNHERDGQSVLYGDGHIAFEDSPLVGMHQDNIYTTRSGKIVAAMEDEEDTILLPVDP